MRSAAVGVAVVLTLVAAGLVLGRSGFEGPVLLPVTYSHGLHAGDVVVLAVWALAMAALALVARRPRR